MKEALEFIELSDFMWVFQGKFQNVSLLSALMACVQLREENWILKTGIWAKAAFIQHKLEHTFPMTTNSMW